MKLGIEKWLQRYFVIAVFNLSAVTLYLSYICGVNLDVTLVVVSALTIGLAFILERKMPFRATWNLNIGDLKTDLSSAMILVVLVEPAVKVILPLLIVTGYTLLGAAYTESYLPFLYQLIAVTLLIEFGKYWSHRWHHAQASLWWLHAMHHSSERLYFLNNLRIHPLNYLVNIFIGLAPAMFLGFSADAILGYLVLTQPLLFIQHANINLNSGWANYIFSTNEVHRWHHSTVPSEANRNYGNALLIWDHVFGTFKAPNGFSKEKGVGLFSSSSGYPTQASYWQQVKSMFNHSCCV
jgi:sterol desaturase/sphingolipid hydroxylase (fatty acid hydroxylase superfamily)